jgi:4-amino-4-deoxy-L-arabinose transferase-like glycosyltransferase
MTDAQSFAARAALSLPGAIGTVLLPMIRRFATASSESFDRTLFRIYIASRIALFALVFFVLRIKPRGDVKDIYMGEVNWILRGLHPYSDFRTSYAPLHPYMDTALYLMGHSMLPMIIFAILAEFLAVYLWLRVGKYIVGESTRRNAALLYLASPFSIQFVTIDGQDNSLLALALAAALLFMLLRRFVNSGMAIGIGVALIKFLPLLYLPQIWFGLKARWRWTLGFLIPVIVGYGYFVYKKVNLLLPLQWEGHLHSASNLPYVFGLLTGYTLPDRIFDLITLAALAAAVVWLIVRTVGKDLAQQVRLISFGSALLMVLLMTLSKKSWPNYFVIFLFNLCLLPAFRSIARRVAFAAIQVIGCLAHSYWSTFFKKAEGWQMHVRIMAHQPSAVSFCLLQTALVSGYIWLIVLLIQELNRDGEPASKPTLTVL